MDPKETENVLQMEWAAISAAPFSFIAALAVIGVVIWYFTRSFYKQRMVTLTDRRELAHEQAEAAKKAQQDTETKLKELEKAVEREAAQRRVEVSQVVATAIKEAWAAMQSLSDIQSDLGETISDVRTEVDIIAAHAAADTVLTAEDVKRIEDKD